jgi:clusterin-associated protein 1
MDEYEKVEVELVKFYELYMERFRNLTFLEQQLDEYNRGEQDKFDVILKSLIVGNRRESEENARSN